LKKSSQFFLSCAALAVIIGFSVFVYLQEKKLLPVWLIGVAIGFVLYRSGMCFATMYQDIFLFRNFSMARAVLLLMIVSLIGIYFIQIFAHLNGQTIPGKFHSFGVHTAVGAFLFGVGMTLAGGCASGTLQRIGEGFLLFWFVLFGMVLGSIFGAYNYTWWVSNFYTHQPVFLSDVFGWVPGGVGSLLALGGIYYLTVILEKRSSICKRSEKNDGKKAKPPGGGLPLSSINNTEGT